MNLIKDVLMVTVVAVVVTLAMDAFDTQPEPPRRPWLECPAQAEV